MILFRKFTFWLAVLGLAVAGRLIVELRAEFLRPLPAPPIAPAPRPAGRTLGAAGLIESRAENTAVGAPVPGLVVEIPATPWTVVKAGDPLFRLDDRELRAQLAVRSAAEPVAQARVRQLENRLARADGLLAGGASPAAERDDLRDELAVARAQLDAARADIRQTRVLLDRLIVRAPRDGTILQVNIRPGEYVVPGAARPPLLLGDLTRLHVRADVDEQLAPRVAPGAPAIGYLKGEGDHPLALTFVRIEPVIVPKVSLTGASAERVDTRVLQIIYALPENPARPLYVGQQIDLYIQEAE